jgi:hypothetical protein
MNNTEDPYDSLQTNPPHTLDSTSDTSCAPDVVGGLQAILDEADADIQRLFGVALSIFAGPNAISKTDAEKLALLESKIRTP